MFFASFLNKNEYLCDVLCVTYFKFLLRTVGLYINKEASLMLCFWLYEPRKFKQLIKNIARSECLRVWSNYIPGCVVRIVLSSYTLFWCYTKYIPAQADFYSFTYMGLRGPQEADGLDGCLRFLSCGKPN